MHTNTTNTDTMSANELRQAISSGLDKLLTTLGVTRADFHGESDAVILRALAATFKQQDATAAHQTAIWLAGEAALLEREIAPMVKPQSARQLINGWDV